jgi:hypothetical protein
MRIILIVSVGVAAVVLSVGAQEIPPNATPSTTAKNGGAVGKLDSEQKTDGTKQASPATPPIPTCTQAFPCFVVEEPQAKSKEEQAKEDSLDLLYRRYMRATIIGVCGAFIGLVILIWQTVLVRRSANAALLNAQAVINSERPWIVVTVKKHPLYSGSFIFLATNKGRTPAEFFSASAGDTFVNTPDDLPTSPDYSHVLIRPNKTLLARNESFEIYPEAGVSPSAMAKSHYLPKNSPSSNQILIFYGMIVYDDVFGKDRPDYTQHRTRWCYACLEGKRFIRTSPNRDPDEYNGYT